MQRTNGCLITAVEPGSPADRAGIIPGERILSINGEEVPDLIAYLALSASWRCALAVAGGGRTRKVAIEKSDEESLGLSFDGVVFDGIRRCGNKCVFCFVDQLPKGLRPTLYVKDEDYRLSFLQGNYITLSNLSPADLKRIKTMRLSPLYVSVHATDPAVRGRLLGLDGTAPILPALRDLVENGIRLQTQAVICPGWNDGSVLDRTIGDLEALWPGIQSLAVVPVGLTAHRQGLTPLRPFSPEEARALLRQLQPWQERFLARSGTRFVFAADEFYVMAGEQIPPGSCYEDYPQIENGVGLVRSFEDEFRMAWRRWRREVRPGRVRVVTGTAASAMWMRLARLTRPVGLELEILPVVNRFFGESVTVAGLLTGADIVRALADLSDMPAFVPRVALQRRGTLFLDGMTEAELTARTGAEVIDTDPAAFLAAAIRVLSHD